MIDPSEDLWLLHSFTDAIDAGKACGYLEVDGIPFLLEDVSEPQQGIKHFSSPPAVRLDLRVQRVDLERAKACLRAAMRLFPEREADVVMRGGDDEEVFVQAVVCDAREDAEAVRGALSQAGLRSRITKIVDEDDVNYVTYSVEVNGEDVESAVRVVEHWGESSGDM